MINNTAPYAAEFSSLNESDIACQLCIYGEQLVLSNSLYQRYNCQPVPQNLFIIQSASLEKQLSTYPQPCPFGLICLG